MNQLLPTDQISGNKFVKPFILLLILAGLYLTSLYNYLLFHSLVEFFSIFVAFTLFMLAWHARQYIQNPYISFIGIAYLFIGFIDLLHTLSYTGMSIFIDYDYYGNQLWIAARYLESLSLLTAFAFLADRNLIIRPGRILAGFTLITALLVASIFYWKIFPICFVEGQGLTAFKTVSEYIICCILVFSLVLLANYKKKFTVDVYRLLTWAIILTIVSELTFTLYVSNYGFANLVGHYFKIFSFFCIYQAIVVTSIEKPYELIFQDLTKANNKLAQEVETRKSAESELRKALADIKTLSGLLPICSVCNKIRDDQGYWEKIEAYLATHTNASFSHGYCPECFKKARQELKDYKKANTPAKS
ncbi:MAG: hypothetical protein OEY01_15105 [Desulfobulbaceae bacterium]|nr:hypothetical protein [Desulfobulbaceae bacterium]HIJ79915.1 hypothetical protein [Deltaproteobacteria bacterium]